jgi:hypothetical protein
MPMTSRNLLRDLPILTSKAVAYYWKTRTAQNNKQHQTGKADQGLRSAVTGGAQMDGFIDLFTELIKSTGISDNCISERKLSRCPASSARPRNGICS